MIRNLIKKSFLLHRIYRRILFYTHHYQYKSINARKESERRRKLSFSAIEELSGEIDCPYYYSIIENNLYGNGSQIFPAKDNLNVDFTAIEHGFIYGSLVQEFHITSWTSTVITFSDYRKKFLKRKTDKRVVCVGPYIHYANEHNVISESKMMRLKETWGKTLLVFPSHSLMYLDVQFDSDSFLGLIDKKSKDFDTVIICLYWADVRKGQHLHYIEKGYQVITAGHIYDKYFLDRLKAFFKLSDAVLSNSVGTHIGYSILLNKPLMLFNQKIVSSLKDPKSIELKQRANDDIDSLEEIKKKLFDLFSQNNFNSISETQYSFVSKLFGFKYIQNDQ